MPPIINSEHTKITLDTKNIFIDTTATDQTKLGIVINMVVTMFSQYTTPEPFVVEPVRVVYEADGRQVITPDLSTRPITVDADYINKFTALKLSPQQVCDLLCKMGNEAIVSQAAPSTASEITVQLSPTRPDILHPCDLVEDAAIAYGFDNLVKTFPTTNTVARPQPINKLTDIVRRECAYSGWVEVLPLILVRFLTSTLDDIAHSQPVFARRVIRSSKSQRRWQNSCSIGESKDCGIPDRPHNVVARLIEECSREQKARASYALI